MREIRRLPITAGRRWLIRPVFKNRRAVQNHLKSVHAIAMCNAAEVAAGTCLHISLHGDFRWIPVGMDVQYLKIAQTDLIAGCRIDSHTLEEGQEVVIPVVVRRHRPESLSRENQDQDFAEEVIAPTAGTLCEQVL